MGGLMGSSSTNSNQNTAQNSASSSNYGTNTSGASNTAYAQGPSAAGQTLINSATDPSSTIANTQSYMNPYNQYVLGSMLPLEQQQNAIQQNQLVGNAVSQGALGGDRVNVAQGVLAGQQGLANNMANA